MRELDLLLAAFLAGGYRDLDATGRDAFERFLDQPDQDILDWVLGRATPADPDLVHTVVRLRGALATAGGTGP